MRVILLIFLIVVNSLATTNLHQKCKSQMDGECEQNRIQSLIYKATEDIIRLRKDMFETTQEFNARREAKYTMIDNSIISAIKDEVKQNGAGKVTLLDYNADKSIMKLLATWNENLTSVLPKKSTPKSFSLIINPKDAKRIFTKKQTHRFYINISYISHQLIIYKIYIKVDGEEYIFDGASNIVNIDGVFYQIDTTETLAWEDAKKYCADLSLGGYSDWRLPTIKELEKIVSDCSGINVKLSDTQWSEITDKNIANISYQSCYKSRGFISNDYWSSSSFANYDNYAWGITFSSGYADYSYKDEKRYVRCMRAGKTP